MTLILESVMCSSFHSKLMKHLLEPLFLAADGEKVKRSMRSFSTSHTARWDSFQLSRIPLVRKGCRSSYGRTYWLNGVCATEFFEWNDRKCNAGALKCADHRKPRHSQPTYIVKITNIPFVWSGASTNGRRAYSETEHPASDPDMQHRQLLAWVCVCAWMPNIEWKI